jgi:hypothetical protein
MAEYGAFLWDASPEPHHPNAPWGPNDPGLLELGLSPGLVERLTTWHAVWEEMAYSNVGFASPEARREWVERGSHLASELKDELPDTEVRYFHSAQSGRER